MRNLIKILIDLGIATIIFIFLFWFLKQIYKYVKELIKLNRN